MAQRSMLAVLSPSAESVIGEGRMTQGICLHHGISAGFDARRFWPGKSLELAVRAGRALWLGGHSPQGATARRATDDPEQSGLRNIGSSYRAADRTLGGWECRRLAWLLVSRRCLSITILHSGRLPWDVRCTRRSPPPSSGGADESGGGGVRFPCIFREAKKPIGASP